jgi:hypothetical protein
MGHQIVRDSWEPLCAECIEARLLDGVEQGRGLEVVRFVLPMNRGVVEAAMQNDAIGEGTETAVRGGIRLRETDVSALNTAEGTRAGGDRAAMAG